MSRVPCTNNDGSWKRQYKSRQVAEKAAQRTNRDHKNDDPPAPYLCPNGKDHWHVGHDGFAP